MGTIEQTTPAAPTRARGRPAPGAWSAGAVLLAGIAAVALAVAASTGVDLHDLHVIHGDGDGVHVVAGTYPGVWIDPSFNPFTEDRLRLLTPIAALVYFLGTAGIGLVFVDAIRGAAGWPRAVRLLAGFLPGYLMLLAPLQILFAAVPTFTAAWIALVATPVAALLVNRRALAATATALRHDRDRARRAWLMAAGTIGLIVLICAVHRLQAGRYFMLPDSIRYFVGAADAQLAGQLGDHLAQWAQQSDEWVFNAPLVFDAHVSRDEQFAYWSTQFVALASFVALIFGMVWTLAWRRRALAGALAVGLILVATPAIAPWENVAIVGGQNPAFFLAHPGRQVSVLAPWIALLILGRWSPRQTAAILLATAGLAFTTVDAVFFVAIAVGSAGLWRLVGERRIVPSRAGRITIHVLALAVLLAPLLVYYMIHHSDQPDALGWVLVGAGVLALAGVAVLAAISAPATAARPRATSWPATIGLSLATAATLGAGFFLSNNMVGSFADGGVRRAIGSVLPGFQATLLDRQIPFDMHFPAFTGQECTISGHCLSFGSFLAVYGFTLVLALAGWVALGRIGADEQVNRRRAAWLVTVASLALAFAIVDFTGVDSSTAWILTRFIEVPFYSILAFAAIALVASRSRFTVAVGTAVLGVWIVVPFLHSHIPEQWIRNADYLLGTLR